ncbi:hypothetical protein NIES2119_22395 [[Phormidium ambiguum] IAM M-71]|uniref:Uncharacterized protein n=1 Tax=[Phormidium ambiguum] IAM M-71 TaxID=454136 RepID=A0A1U7IAV0_9CYAN|nr:hypothetical protein [Phormidium ambiguum]OKH33678.1 hypothetical protein NIES2119_22395 [Phormidium ambiguum IAM M-71]
MQKQLPEKLYLQTTVKPIVLISDFLHYSSIFGSDRNPHRLSDPSVSYNTITSVLKTTEDQH